MTLSALYDIEILRTACATVYLTSLYATVRGCRREAEIAAEQKLITAVFGPGHELRHTPDGAPCITGVDLPVSISHGAGRCVLAVSTDGRPVGVDIECWREQLRRISRKFLTSEEFPRYSGCEELLLQSWAAKEAVFKAAGMPELTVSRITVDIDEKTATVADGRLFSFEIYGEFPETLVVARQA